MTIQFTIPEFWLGVLSLFAAEVILVIIIGVRYARKQKKKAKEGEPNENN